MLVALLHQHYSLTRPGLGVSLQLLASTKNGLSRERVWWWDRVQMSIDWALSFQRGFVNKTGCIIVIYITRSRGLALDTPFSSDVFKARIIETARWWHRVQRSVE